MCNGPVVQRYFKTRRNTTTNKKPCLDQVKIETRGYHVIFLPITTLEFYGFYANAKFELYLKFDCSTKIKLPTATHECECDVLQNTADGSTQELCQRMCITRIKKMVHEEINERLANISNEILENKKLLSIRNPQVQE